MNAFAEDASITSGSIWDFISKSEQSVLRKKEFPASFYLY